MAESRWSWRQLGYYGGEPAAIQDLRQHGLKLVNDEVQGVWLSDPKGTRWFPDAKAAVVKAREESAGEW